MRSKVSAPVAKRHNTALVYSALREARRGTAQELALATGLSVMTVGGILAHLVTDGRARKGPLIPSGGGRPSQCYEFNEIHAYAAVICARADAGGALAQTAVADLLGQVLWEQTFPLTRIALDSFVPLVQQALNRFPAVAAIGFSMPGTEHDARLGMAASDFSALLGTRFSEFYRKQFRLPVAFENDANAAALGWVARHPQTDSLAYLYFPPGFAPGVGLYLNGRLWRGCSSAAGEVGRLPLNIDWHSLADAPAQARCDALARMTALSCAIADPQAAVLTGPPVTDDLLEGVRRRCGHWLIHPPEIAFSHHFAQDIQAGMIRSALELLEAPLGFCLP